MNPYLLAGLILYHTIIFSIGQFPVIIFLYFNKMNLLSSNQKQKYFRMINTSLTIAIISIYNIMATVLDESIFESKISNYVSLFFSIVLIILLCISMYSVIDHILVYNKGKKKKILLNIAIGLLTFFAIVAIFTLFVIVEEFNLYYLHQVSNIVYPFILAMLSLVGIIGLFSFKKLKNEQKKYIITIAMILPCYLVDVLLLKDVFIQLVSIPFIVYIAMMFHDVLFNVINDIKTKTDKPNIIETIKEYDLTEREIDVVKLVIKGYTNKKISEELFVSIHTVKSHMQHIFTKFKVKTRYELISILNSDMGE